jgi:hypothetical protein
MPSVLWIARHSPAVTAHTREASRVLQSFFVEPAPADTNLFYAAGIDGTGQIINIVDGGLATLPCFFNESPAFTFDSFNASARKLIYYATTFGDRLATADGHGTEMASIAAGAALAGSSPLADEANRYRGIAYNARIAFTDIEHGDTGRKVPTDFALLWQSALFNGARIFSHSFSDNVTVYGETDRQIDSFVSQNPSLLAIVSAGNGQKIAWEAKNVLIVGSSRNDRTSRAIVLGNERFLLYVNDRFSFEMAGVRCNRGRTVFDNSTLTGRLIFNAARPTGCVESDLAGVDVFGRVVMVDRGACPDEQKLLLLERLGARAAVLVHNDTGPLVYTASGLTSLSIYTWAIAKSNGDFVKQRIAAGDDVRLYMRFDINRQGNAEANVDAGVVSNFSSRGPLADGRLAPHIVAVGESLRAINGLRELCGFNAFTYHTGTSGATALVAGAAALVRQYFADGFYPSGARDAAQRRSPSAALLRAVMIGAGTCNSCLTPNYDIGFGHLRLQRALKVGSRGPSNMFAVDGAAGEAAGFISGGASIKSFCFRMVGGDNGLVNEPFRASLAWLDVPAFAGASEVLMNNLDLTVTNARSRETFLGNSALYNNTADRANTLEQVTIGALALEAGHTLRVSVHAISFTPATNTTFALFVTGSFQQVTCGSDDHALCPNQCSGAGSCNPINGRCTTCNAGCKGSDCSAVTSGSQFSAHCPSATRFGVATPTPPRTTQPPAATAAPTPSLTPIPLPLECAQCGSADGSLSFGAINSERWCRCCAADCFDFRRECRDVDFFCVQQGTCINQFPAICASVPVMPTPAPTPQNPCSPCPSSVVGSSDWCNCCANNCNGVRDSCRVNNGFCRSTCLSHPLCVAESMITTPSPTPSPPTRAPTPFPTPLPTPMPTPPTTARPSPFPTPFPTPSPTPFPTPVPPSPLPTPSVMITTSSSRTVSSTTTPAPMTTPSPSRTTTPTPSPTTTPSPSPTTTTTTTIATTPMTRSSISVTPSTSSTSTSMLSDGATTTTTSFVAPTPTTNVSSTLTTTASTSSLEDSVSNSVVEESTATTSIDDQSTTTTTATTTTTTTTTESSSITSTAVDIVSDGGLSTGEIIGIAVGVSLAACLCSIALLACACFARRQRQLQQDKAEAESKKSVQEYETIYGEIQLPTLQIETLSDEPSYDIVPTIRTMNMSHSGVISAAQDDSVAGSSADSSESSSGTIQIVRSKTTYESRID